jgi:hypothetical protein
MTIPSVSSVVRFLFRHFTLVMLAVIAIPCLGVWAHFTWSRHWAAERHRNVALRAGMTLADLRSAFGEEGNCVPDRQTANSYQLSFGSGIVHATFIGVDAPSVNATPAELSVADDFRGTLCGVTIGTPIQDAVEILRKQYPDAVPGKKNEYDDTRVSLTSHWDFTCHGVDQIRWMGLWNRDYEIRYHRF